MFKSNDEGPISPMKKLKILSESQNVQKPREHNLEPIKESNIGEQTTTATITTTPEEPLLQESTGQYVIFPINNQDMWHMYKHFVDSFWGPAENLEEFDKLNFNYDEKTFMKYLASFFASPNSVGLVVDTFAEDLCKIIQVTEARFFYGHQLFVQDIHYEMFNKILDKVVAAQDEKDKMFKIVEAFDAVQNKRAWISQWNKADFGIKICASACIHGLFFISLDLALEWLKNKLRGSFTHELIETLERIIADQELIRDFACMMLSHVKSKPSRDKMLEMINSSAKIEFDFIVNGLKMELIPVEADDLIQMIDKKTKALKMKIFGSLEEKKKSNQVETVKPEITNAENTRQKENHQKIVFDEDF